MLWLRKDFGYGNLEFSFVVFSESERRADVRYSCSEGVVWTDVRAMTFCSYYIMTG